MSDRYQIEEEIGEGGEGAVFKAYDSVLKRHVALKRVLTKDRGTAEEVEKAANALVAEAQSLSALNHPNIVTVYDVGKDEEGGFVVMELIKGETLDDVVKRGVLTEEDFQRFARQTMEALMAAQEINMVHRDLKPGNVMMVWLPGGRFQAKILDFGLAKFSEVPSLQTLGFDDSVKGSIYFMAPEQFERAELDERTDLYAMGCVYYFALTGKHPFGGESMTMVMVSHLQHQVVSLEKLRPDLSPTLCQWVMWLINRDIDTRPESAEVALNHFPQNQTAAQQQDLINLPVNKERSGLTEGVRVVLPTQSARAPTGMVVLPDGQEAASVEPFDEARYDEEFPSENQREKKGGVGAFVGVGLLVAGLAYFGWSMLVEEGKVKSGGAATVEGQPAVDSSQSNRFEELAGKTHPAGTAQDVDLALVVLASKEATGEQKRKAQKVLAELEGAGVDEAILGKLKNTKEPVERVALSRALAARGVEGSVPALVGAIEAAKDDRERMEIMGALGGVVSAKTLPAVIDSLKKDHSPVLRNALEQAVASVFRRIPASQENLSPLMDRLDAARGNERASLWRILGLRGGTVVTKKLEQVFLREKSDKDALRDAMGALVVIRTPQVVNMLNTVFSTTQDGELKKMAADALTHAVTVPSNDQLDVRSFWWQLALKAVTREEELHQVFSSIADYTYPKTVVFLQSMGNSRTFRAYSEKALAKVQRLDQEAPLLGAGEWMVLRHSFSGEGGAEFDPEEKAVTDWVDPGTWFIWHFKVKETGGYRVEVLQSMVGDDESQFNITIGESALWGRAQDTGAWTDYQPVGLSGSVTLEAGKLNVLFLQAGEVVPMRMMNIKGVRLQKQ